MSKEVVTEDRDRKGKDADDKENKFWSVVFLEELFTCEKDIEGPQKGDKRRKNGPITPLLFF